MLLSVAETANRINQGEILMVAGEENLLRQLPKGQWIGGTIPYFMTEKGGLSTQTELFVTILPSALFPTITIRAYAPESLAQMTQDAPENGLSFIIIPATSQAHIRYAQDAPNYPDMFMKPIIGWISGVHLEQLGRTTPKVINGSTGDVLENHAVVMHLGLTADKMALINIINLFELGEGDDICFETGGFSVTDCLINGEKQNFAQYLLSRGIDTKYPLVADYCGALVNVSFQSVDAQQQCVHLYAPVFNKVTYRIAKPLGDYVSAFKAALPHGLTAPIFACNCILNYLYSELEGQHTDPITGPMTFGEIAYQLLNQTLVYVEIQNIN
ncbi:DUF6976 family protein [Thioflexithrix psekupsensis]|uniref:Uncharacterized protein n=1 Tax=Thioflexithrix psekupsensis TaxID=1570016 RepID=A0A251X8Q7_9GAMM|nr:hypothetical protein [Thioflexithrix psekupsensis]OUD14164.1 hypothetical protein TPSD3_07475 [Thioflexithrix psekupsensis]